MSVDGAADRDEVNRCDVPGVPPTRKHVGTHMEPSSEPNTAIKRRPEEGRWPKHESGESSIVVFGKPDVKSRRLWT
jgi:hypothetical protein